jgi:hypothetical protein
MYIGKITKFLPGIVVLAVSFGLERSKAANTTLTARGRELQRRTQELNRQLYEFEARAYGEQAAYANREQDALLDALTKIRHSLTNPANFFNKPNWKDLLSLAKDTAKRMAPTAGNLVDLVDEANGLQAKQLSLAMDIAAYQRDVKREVAKDANNDPVPPPPPPPPSTLLSKVDDVTLREWVDDIYDWCYDYNRGDRCFDGEPDRFAEFVKRRPEVSRQPEAVRHLPEQENSDITTRKCSADPTVVSSYEESIRKFETEIANDGDCRIPCRECDPEDIEALRQTCRQRVADNKECLRLLKQQLKATCNDVR